MNHVGNLVDHLFRTSAGQMVAYLARLLGPAHLDLAEEVVQDALLKAFEQWPHSGIPENPGGWLFRVARNKALDAVRRNTVFADKAQELAHELTRGQRATEEHEDLDEKLRDAELRMVFMCCHPAISQDARVALSLKTVGGFSTREIACAFLADESTVAQRLVRAKRQIREAGLSLDLPAGGVLAERLDSVLEVLYLMFNEGYAAHEGENLIREDLCFEALRLGQLVAASSVSTPKAHALVALMALQAARLRARLTQAGELVLFEEQDRLQWDRRLIALGFHHFDDAIAGPDLSEYHVQAAIAATYARAEDPRTTDWATILDLYDQLASLNYSPVVRLNRAAALAKVHGAQAALMEIQPLMEETSLRDYYLLPAVRGQLLFDLGEREQAAECFRAALACRCSLPERRFLQGRLAKCTSQ